MHYSEVLILNIEVVIFLLNSPIVLLRRQRLSERILKVYMELFDVFFEYKVDFLTLETKLHHPCIEHIIQLSASSQILFVVCLKFVSQQPPCVLLLKDHKVQVIGLGLLACSAQKFNRAELSGTVKSSGVCTCLF